MTNDKKHYLLWSGGFDSTAILLKLCKTSSEENPVYAIDCNYTSGLSQDQWKAQRKAKDKILKKLNKKGYHIKEIKITIDIDSFGSSNFLIQPLWWNLAAINIIRDDTRFHFGYIGSDTAFWKIKNEFETAFWNMCGILKKKNVDIIYDFSNETKDYILELIKDNDLYDDCWTCESPIKKGRKYIPCRKCSKCSELELYEYKIKLDKKIRNRKDERKDGVDCTK